MFLISRSLPRVTFPLIIGLGTLLQTDLSLAQTNPNLCQQYPQDLRCSLFNYTQESTASTPLPSSTQPRIAVLDFDRRQTRSDVPQNLSSLVIDQLVRGGRYQVVERGAIEALLREQDLGSQGRIDPSTAAQIGRLLGVDAVVVGAVTQSDVTSRRSGGGFPVLAPLGRSPIAVGATTTDFDAIVRLNVRLVSATTGEILTTAAGFGNASQSSSTVTVAGIGGGSEVNNQTQLLSQATDQAIAQITPQLNAAAPLLSRVSAAPPSPGVIADVEGNGVIINRGTDQGYQVGQIFQIERVVREVLDPETGEKLREITEPVGQVQITEVDTRSSVGIILMGTDLQIGDAAQPIDL